MSNSTVLKYPLKDANQKVFCIRPPQKLDDLKEMLKNPPVTRLELATTDGENGNENSIKKIKFNNNDHMFNLENYNPTIENIPYFFSIEENAGKTENSGDMLYEDIIGVYPSNLINHIHDYRDAVSYS